MPSGWVTIWFDEAAALFGRRSEVKDGHDRYAMLEVGYPRFVWATSGPAGEAATPRKLDDL